MLGLKLIHVDKRGSQIISAHKDDLVVLADGRVICILHTLVLATDIPSGAETIVFRENNANITTADILAPGIPMASSVRTLIMYNKQTIFIEQQMSVPSYCHQVIKETVT